MSSAPLILAVPSKGRLQQNAEAFSPAPGSNSSSRAARAIIAAPSPGFDGIEVAYLSAAEITRSSAKARCISASPAKTWCAK